MKFFERLGFLATSAVLWLIAAVGFFGMQLFPPLVLLCLPFILPGFIVLGIDEVQESYGYWGELFYDWLLALPCVLLYAWLIRRWFAARARQSLATP